MPIATSILDAAGGRAFLDSVNAYAGRLKPFPSRMREAGAVTACEHAPDAIALRHRAGRGSGSLRIRIARAHQSAYTR
jgi:hypothetical protein